MLGTYKSALGLRNRSEGKQVTSFDSMYTWTSLEVLSLSKIITELLCDFVRDVKYGFQQK
jgi:hypothetical protein